MPVAVVPEGLQLGEGLVAHAAVVGPVAFPQPPPQPVVGRADKGAAADPALEVVGPTLRLRSLALVRRGRQLLVCVAKNVCHQPSLLREGFAAERALERFLPRVDSPVRFEMRSASEALPTFGTLEGPLPRVDQLVRHQVGVLLEVLAANTAPVLPLLAVGIQVEFEVGRGDEGLLADVAGAGLQVNAPLCCPLWSSIKQGALTGGTLAGLGVGAGLRGGEAAPTQGAERRLRATVTAVIPHTAANHHTAPPPARSHHRGLGFTHGCARAVRIPKCP